jgi:hypothetical protein
LSTTDERDDSSVDLVLVEPAEGDDIVVVPGPGDAERTRRRRAAFALGGVAGALVIVGGIALLARNLDSGPAVVQTSSPTTIDTKAISSEHSTTTVAAKTTTPAVVATTAPTTAAPQTVVTSPAIVPPPTAPPIVSPTVAAVAQYGASVLTWTAPSTLTVASGKTAPLAVTAHNPTNGTVTLPHPLACTPRLDHTGVCAEMVQLIGAGQSASAQYTIDAKGIAPGKYSLSIEGVLTVAVTVS